MSDAVSLPPKRLVWPYYAEANAPKPTRTTGNQLGKDQFLKILMTQLRNQDPSKPLEDREFIAQMSQFSLVEQVMNMTQELAQLRQSSNMAFGLIGKKVTWDHVDASGKTIGTRSGVVQAIEMQNKEPSVRVGDEHIPILRLTKVEQVSP